MLKRHTVSVIVTCFNLHKYLDECLQSLQAQTLLPSEVIVVHDGCEAPPGYSNTTTLHRPMNNGVSVARNEGAALSNGEFLLFVDADDVLAENFIEKSLQDLVVDTETFPHVVYPDVLLWAKWGDSSFPNKWHQAPEVLTHQAMYDRCECVITSMMRREVFEKLGGFRTHPLFEDWDFHLRALSSGYRYEKAATYLKYRQREKSRNRAPDEIRNQYWNEVRDRFELVEGELHEKKSA